MPNIKPVSDLRNYGRVLEEVSINQPVFLTRNGHGEYAVLDINEYNYYQKMLAKERLIAEIELGYNSGQEQGWIDADKEFSRLEKKLAR